jgi:hypothetical protein
MGKWEKLCKLLAALPVDADWQRKVDEAKMPMRAMNSQELAKRIDRAARRKKQLEDQEKLANIEIEAGNQLLLDRMDAEGVEQVRTRSGILFTRHSEPYPTVEVKALLFKWIKQTRSVYLLSVHFKRLQSLVKECLEAGKAMPPGVRVFVKTTVRRTGRQKGGNNSEKDTRES